MAPLCSLTINPFKNNCLLIVPYTYAKFEEFNFCSQIVISEIFIFETSLAWFMLTGEQDTTCEMGTFHSFTIADDDGKF